MKKKFASLPLLLSIVAATNDGAGQSRGGATAQPPTAREQAQAPTDPGKAQWLAAQAAAAIQSRSAVSAQLRCRAELMGYEMLGAGAYWQQGRAGECKLRLEMRLQVQDQPMLLRQVCDSDYLWTQRERGDERTIERVDLRRAARERIASGGLPDSMGLSAAGGLPQLLTGLAENVEFTSAQAARMQGIPMWVLMGAWNRNRLMQLLPEQRAALEQGQAADLTKLPAHVPDQVVLVIGQDDFFPYRIEYRRRNQDAAKQDAAARASMLIEFFNVRIGEPVDPRTFAYQPPLNADVRDTTEAYVHRDDPAE